MNRRTLAATPIAILAVLTATIDVHSAGTPVSRGLPAVNVTGLVQRAAGRTVKSQGRAVPAADYFTKTPRETPVTLRSGAKTTLGRVMDSYARLDAAMKAKGSSLDGIPKNRWANGATPAGIQESTVAAAELNRLVTKVDPNKPHGQVSYPQGDPNRAQAVDFNMDKSFFVITPYNYFNVTASDPAAQNGTTCSVSWNAGLKLYSKQFDFVKIVGTESTSGASFLSATIHIYVLGNSEFVGDLGIDGDPPFEKALSTSQLPGGEPSADMDVVPGVMKVHAVAGGSAYFKLFPYGDSGAVQGKDTGFFCSLDIKPTLRTEGHLRADAYIGPTIDGMPALTVSARGSIAPLQLDLPTRAVVAVLTSPAPKIAFGLTSALTMELMTGKVDFTWQLPDICEGGSCVMADGLGVATSGDIASWSKPPTVVNGPYVNVDSGLGGDTLVSQ